MEVHQQLGERAQQQQRERNWRSSAKAERSTSDERRREERMHQQVTRRTPRATPADDQARAWSCLGVLASAAAAGALTFGVHRPQLAHRTGLTAPRPLRFFPPLRLFFVMVGGGWCRCTKLAAMTTQRPAPPGSSQQQAVSSPVSPSHPKSGRESDREVTQTDRVGKDSETPRRDE